MAFFDETDTMAGPNFRNGSSKDKNGFVIQFYHVPTIRKSLEKSNLLSHATFKAFITSFSDNFKINWNEKETMGRMDSIQTFKNTKRNISISFEAPANSKQEALENFYELEKLIMMQYPVYEKVDIQLISSNLSTENTQLSSSTGTQVSASTTPVTQASASAPRVDRDNAAAVAATQEGAILNMANGTGRFMSSPPLIYVKFKNWIGNGKNFSAESDVSDSLVVTLSEVSFKQDLDSGVFINNGFLVPMLFTVDLNMTVIHTTELGWTKDKSDQYLFGEGKASEIDPKTKKYPSFPYNINTTLVDE
jgi:hypothetical protein